MLYRQAGLGNNQGSWSGAVGSVWASLAVGCCEADSECWADRSSSCQGVSGGIGPRKILSWPSYHSRWARNTGLVSSGIGVVAGSVCLGDRVGSAEASAGAGSSEASADAGPPAPINDWAARRCSGDRKLSQARRASSAVCAEAMATLEAEAKGAEG